MRNLLLILLTVPSISCNGQEKKTEQKSDNYVVTFRKDGETIKDTVAIQDTTLRNELQRMMADPDYKTNKSQNDTVFNSRENPTLVKLDDDIFGASIQKFEYDSTDKLIRITGHDDQKNIKPFHHDIAIQINKYDQNGNLVEIRNLGKDEQLISSEYEDTPIIRMKYNEKNQLVEKWFLDERESLRSEFSIIKFNYDDQGNRTTKGWYNEKGEKQ